MSFQQTQLEEDPDNYLGSDRSDYEAGEDDDRDVIPPTPPPNQKSCNSASRSLLKTFNMIRSSPDELNPPRWYADDLGILNESPMHSRRTGDTARKSMTPQSSVVGTPQSTPRTSTPSSGSSSSSKKVNSQPSSRMATPQFTSRQITSHLTSRMVSPPSTSKTIIPNEDVLQSILHEVKSTNERLNAKLVGLEQKLANLEDEGGKSFQKKKKQVPSAELRDLVRKVYRCISEEDENLEWDTSVGFTDRHNKEILQKLVLEVKSYGSTDIPSSLIKDAARTYYNSITSVERMKQSGKYKRKCAVQRRRNRLRRKLLNREAALAKTSALNDDQKEKWGSVLVPDLISSEDSCSDSDEPNVGGFIIRPLPWRSDSVNNFFVSLDKKIKKKQSKRSKLMSFSRTEGTPSDRPKPSDSSLPAWALK